MKIKIIIPVLLLFVLLVSWTMVDRSVSVFENEASVVINPLRDAPKLVSQVVLQPLDFSELDKPFSADSEGTEIAGQLRIDDAGDLIVDGELKAFFDYFLSSVGQVTAEQAIHRIHLLAAKQLPSAAAQQAMQTLQDYLAFKEASIDLMAKPIDQNLVQTDPNYRLQQLEYALNSLVTLRREYMDANAAAAFFKDEEAYGEYTIQTQRISLNDQLSEADAQQQRILARENLPEKMRVIITEQENRAQAIQGLQALMNEAADHEQVSQYAYANFDSEEAQSVLENYSSEQALKVQYQQYRQQLERLTEQQLSAEQFEDAKAQLAQQYFKQDQLSIVQAWDFALVD